MRIIGRNGEGFRGPMPKLLLAAGYGWIEHMLLRHVDGDFLQCHSQLLSPAAKMAGGNSPLAAKNLGKCRMIGFKKLRKCPQGIARVSFSSRRKLPSQAFMKVGTEHHSLNATRRVESRQSGNHRYRGKPVPQSEGWRHETYFLLGSVRSGTRNTLQRLLKNSFGPPENKPRGSRVTFVTSPQCPRALLGAYLSNNSTDQSHC